MSGLQRCGDHTGSRHAACDSQTSPHRPRKNLLGNLDRSFHTRQIWARFICPVNELGQIDQVRQAGQVKQVGQLGQLRQLGKLGQLAQLGQLAHLGQIGQRRQSLRYITQTLAEFALYNANSGGVCVI